jgi:Holliday junction DNA helicase RuvA
MMSFLRGTVASMTTTSVALDVHGVGYFIHVTPRALQGLKVGEEKLIPVSLIVREDALTLYGFADVDEKSLFELVQTVTGIGPKLALTIVASQSPEDFVRAIASKDEARLTRIPGVGKKSAARMLIDLQDKVRSYGVTADQTHWQETVTQALISLGWSDKDARAAMTALDVDNLDTSDTGAILRLALAQMSRGGSA